MFSGTLSIEHRRPDGNGGYFVVPLDQPEIESPDIVQLEDGKVTFRDRPGSLAYAYQRMSEDLQGAYWVRDQVLEENERLRRELRMWKLSAARDWGTLSYPDLDADDFDDLENQP